METAYDWVTMFIFAGLVTRFLQQSAGDDNEDASLWHYLLAAVGCALANWLGNEGWHIPAVLTIGLVLAYAGWFILGMGRRDTRH
jgi:hypothetical protein